MALLIAFFAAPFSPKLRTGFALRRQKRNLPHWKKAPIWIHASSGEFEYAKPLIRALHQEDPDQPVVVTYFSPSYAKAISEFPGVTWSMPLPLDLPGATQSFLRQLKPKALLIARTDLWPELLRQVAKQRIPTLLFAATVRSPRDYGFLRKRYLQFIYGLIDHIFTVSAEDLKNLQAFDVKNGRVAGDTRYDQVIYRLQNPKTIKPIVRQNRPPVLVAGSTWPEDESVLVQATLPLLHENVLSLILVPHEIDREKILRLKKSFIENGLSCALYSEINEWQTSVLIIDQVGLLAEVYTAGDLAFVGGSFRKKVHSVMEPLAAGLFTFVGPFHENNREAVEFQNFQIASTAFSAVMCAPKADAFEAKLRDILKDINDLASGHEQIRNEIQKRSGATHEVLRWIKNLPIK